MSQENGELVRRWVASFERDPETFRELMHPDIEWAPFEENHTVFRGVEGAEQVRASWLDAWAEHRIDIEEIIDAGDDLVVVMHLWAVAGAAASKSTCGSIRTSRCATAGPYQTHRFTVPPGGIA